MNGCLHTQVTLQMVLKEKVLVEEGNFQGYQSTNMESLLDKLCGRNRSPDDGSGCILRRKQRLDANCSRTSFKNKFKHSIIRRLRHDCDPTETVCTVGQILL